MSAEVEVDPIQVVTFGDLPQRGDFVLSHFRDGEVPQSRLPPASCNQPFGVLVLQRMSCRCRYIRFAIGAVQTVLPEHFQLSLMALLNDAFGDVNALACQRNSVGYCNSGITVLGYAAMFPSSRHQPTQST